ncbi:MAG: alpha/beta hydrolase [Bacteroidota bacterium]
MPSLQHQLFMLSAQNLGRAVSKDLKRIDTLRWLLEQSTLPFALPKGISLESLTVYGMDAEWVIPEQADRSRAILFLHGGGYTVGSLQTHRAMVAKLALEAGIAALSIDYRLAPEHRFPAALEDALHGYQWLLEKGYDPSHITLVGDSAGGGLVMSTLLTLRELEIPFPQAVCMMSPWLDLTFSAPSAQLYAEDDPIVTVSDVMPWASAYGGDYDLKHPMISPLFGDLKGLPPIFVQVSDHEVLTDDSMRLDAKVREVGGQIEVQVWEGMLHVWQLFWRYIPEGQQALQEMAAFIKSPSLRPVSSKQEK